MERSSPFLQKLKDFLPRSATFFREQYHTQSFFKDLFAGTNVAVIAFPMALAIGIGANLGPNRGIIAAIIGGFCVALFSGSRVQIGGPSNSFMIILYSILLRHGFEGMVTATLMAGLILMLFGIARFGTYIKYIPHTVVAGLTTGLAVVIFSSQFRDFFGLNMPELPIDFAEKWKGYWIYLHTLDPLTLTVGMTTLILMLYLRRFHTHLPYALIALVMVTTTTTLLGLEVETIGSRYGPIQRTIPLPAWPHISLLAMLNLIPDALTLAILIGIESLVSAVVSDGMTGWKHDSNRELIAQGFSNIAISLFGGMPASGALSRTTVNIKSGASSPISGLFHAVVMLLFLLLFAPFVGHIPLASLAALLLMTAWNMSQLSHFFHLFTAPKRDILVLVTVFTLTVLINLTAAVQVGMILAAFLFMKQMSDLSGIISNVRHPSNVIADKPLSHEVPSDVEIFEINGPLFFGVVDRLKNIFSELEQPPKVFILYMHKVPVIDASGMHALEAFYRECHQHRTVLLLAGVQDEVLQDLRRYHFDELIGRDCLFTTTTAAIELAKDVIRMGTFKQAFR